jgi:hypothetical protein
MTELTGDLNDTFTLRRDVMQAHQELATLPGKNGASFRAVTRCLEQDPLEHQVS